MRIIEGQAGDTGVHFLPGSFDVVLCHGVLMDDVEEPDALLAGVARMLAPGGMLSLLVRNGDAAAMRAGLSGDWAGALAAFCPPTTSYGLKRLTSTLAGIGAPLHTWYGVRVFTDTAADDAVLPDDLDAVLAVEDRAGRTDPYRGSRRCCTCAGSGAEGSAPENAGRGDLGHGVTGPRAVRSGAVAGALALRRRGLVGVQAHRAVDLGVVLQQAHLVGAALQECLPVLPDPGLGVPCVVNSSGATAGSTCVPSAFSNRHVHAAMYASQACDLTAQQKPDLGPAPDQERSRTGIGCGER